MLRNTPGRSTGNSKRSGVGNTTWYPGILSNRQMLSQVLVTGDSLECEIPGGWGACGAPNDGWHQQFHALRGSYARASVQWTGSFDKGRRPDELEKNVQSSTATRHQNNFVFYFCAATFYITVCSEMPRRFSVENSLRSDASALRALHHFQLLVKKPRVYSIYIYIQVQWIHQSFIMAFSD